MKKYKILVFVLLILYALSVCGCDDGDGDGGEEALKMVSQIFFISLTIFITFGIKRTALQKCRVTVDNSYNE